MNQAGNALLSAGIFFALAALGLFKALDAGFYSATNMFAFSLYAAGALGVLLAIIGLFFKIFSPSNNTTENPKGIKESEITDDDVFLKG